MRKRNPWFYVAVIFLGSLIGTALGEGLGAILPPGVVKQFFLRAAEMSIGPADINILVLQFTLGFKLKLNIIGVIGIIISAYILKWID